LLTRILDTQTEAKAEFPKRETITSIHRHNRIMKTFKIAVIAGDGIGKEVVPEGIQVLEAAGKRFGFQFAWQPFDWSCERYAATGKMMPDGGLQQLRPFDAIFLGAGASQRARSYLALGLADSDSAGVSAIRESASGAAVRRHRKRRSRTGSPARSIS